MPEFRRNIISDEWVIISDERANRPEIFRKEEKRVKQKINAVCPFDRGNESMTPPEIIRMDRSGKIVNAPTEWQTRVVPNKFPALKPDATLSTKRVGIYDVMDGFGIHEVIINSPDHLLSLSQLNESCIELVIRTYAIRIREIKKDPKFESVVIMLNQGKDAGASLEHTHSQVFATPFIPPLLERELDAAKRYYKKHKCCAMCDILDFEIGDGSRKIFENSGFLIIEPFASGNPFETWILPKKHHSNFETIDDKEISSFAECLKILADFFHHKLNNSQYNYYIHTGPLRTGSNHHYHWHFELIPKLQIKAGFEIASGIDICNTTPEYTAGFMRDNIL